MQMSVSSDICKLIASNEYLSKQNIKAIHIGNAAVVESIGRSIDQQTDQLAAKLDAGFDRLSFDINEVRQSVDRLATVCDTGFSQISYQLDRLDKGISEIIALIKSPEQNWAYEQYEIAQNCCDRGFYSDALAYVDRAISGDGNHYGHKFEYRFHFLRGLIRLGNARNFDRRIVDPAIAVKDFEASARYAEGVDQKGHGLGLQMAGWASYCAGNALEAENFLQKSLRVAQNDMETNYLMAKVQLFLGSKESAEKYFKRAIHGDLMLGLRAGADPDFLDHKDLVESWIQDYRNILIAGCRQHYAGVDLASMRSKWPILVKYAIESSGSKIETLEAKIGQVPSAPLSSLLELKSDIKPLVAACVDSIAAGKRNLQAKAASLEASHVRRTKEKGTNTLFGFGGGFLVAVLTFLISMVLFWPEIYSEGPFFGTILFVFGLLVAGFFAIIAALVSTPIIAIISAAFHELSHNQKEYAHRSKVMGERQEVIADLAKL
ncbi:MAG: hypothetical protein R3D99_08490 [Altererythrobacter sp.]